jgi:hypothetical protein
MEKGKKLNTRGNLAKTGLDSLIKLNSALKVQTKEPMFRNRIPSIKLLSNI